MDEDWINELITLLIAGHEEDYHYNAEFHAAIHLLAQHNAVYVDGLWRASQKGVK